MTVFNVGEGRPLPNQSETCFWADYVEFLVLIDPDRQFSAGRLEHILGIRSDLSEAGPDAIDGDDSDVYAQLAGTDTDIIGLASFPDDTRDEQDGALAQVHAPNAKPLDDDTSGTKPADDDSEAERLGRQTEGKRTRADETFQLLIERMERLGESYPFAVNSDSRVLRAKEALGDGAEYLFLLTCSLQQYLTKNFKTELPKLFEAYSYGLLKSILPRHRVHSFGTARDIGDKGPFTEPKLYERYKQLAGVLNAQLRIEESSVHPSNVGDGGIDVVAWLDAGDKSSPVLATFVQCTVGHDWSVKQAACSFDRMNRIFSLDQSSFTNMLVMSHYYRTKGHRWYTDIQVAAYVVDRYRALALSLGDELPERGMKVASDVWSHTAAGT